MVLQTVFIWDLLENFRKNRFLTQKPALFFSPSTWNTIGHYCKPPPGMGDQKVRKGPSPNILCPTIGIVKIGLIMVISEVGSQNYIANLAIFKIGVFSATFRHEIALYAIDIDKKRFRTPFLTL